MKALLGIKKGMTQTFDEEGYVVPVTEVDVSGCVFVGKKEKTGKDGYDAALLGLGKKRHGNKPETGKYKELGFVPQHISEFRLDWESEKDLADFKVGQEISPTFFDVGGKVKVTGTSKGKGFAGVVKRWGFSGGPKTHGQSDRHRAPGSIGGGTDPGRVYKGKKMPGRMGGRTKTVWGLRVVGVDEKKGVVMISGAVPGPQGSLVHLVQEGSNQE